MNLDVGTPPHGGQLHRIAEQFGIPVEGLVDFSANINPEGPSPLVLQVLREALEDPAILTQYPDLQEMQLRLAISSYVGVVPDAISVANGFVPLLDAALRALPIRNCLMPVPSFSEYRNALERARVMVTPLALDQAADFHYQPDRLLSKLREGGHDSILLANPQNPSGVLSDRDTLKRFTEEAARLNVCVLLDEAFIDYAPEHSLVKDAPHLSNLIVFRSLTKFHGIPGLRVAYAVAQSATTRKIYRNLAPWAITTLAALAGRAAVADGPYSDRTLKLNRERREDLGARLKALGLKTYQAAANFLLIRFRSSVEAEYVWRYLIRDHGIILRHCTNFEAINHDHLRCAVLTDERNLQLVGALAQALISESPVNIVTASAP